MGTSHSVPISESSRKDIVVQAVSTLLAKSHLRQRAIVWEPTEETMPVNGKANGRFELPALTPVHFSLTDGTDIPPPPDSPIEEKPPAFAPAPDRAATVPKNGTEAPHAANGTGRTSSAVAAPPLSPASTTRPNSVRRFLSRNSLNANYNGVNGSQDDLTSRPDSPSSFLSGRPSVGKKRTSSWFSRFGGGKRSSIVYEDSPAEKKAKGPPPPKLPELNQLKAKVGNNDEGSLGGEDMFKNIKG